MAVAFEIVMKERKVLVEKIVAMMKQDGFFGNRSNWNSRALSPMNPLSNTRYRGGNRIRLMTQVMEKGYKDPRFISFAVNGSLMPSTIPQQLVAS